MSAYLTLEADLDVVSQKSKLTLVYLVESKNIYSFTHLFIQQVFIEWQARARHGTRGYNSLQRLIPIGIIQGVE